MNEAVLQHSFPGARSISGPLRLFTEHPLFIHLPLSYLSLHCWPHTATLWRSKLNVERVEKGKGLFWEKGTFFVNLKGLWENPFSLSWVFEQWVIGKPHPHVPTHACQTHVRVCVYIVTYSMDQWTLTPHVRELFEWHYRKWTRRWIVCSYSNLLYRGTGGNTQARKKLWWVKWIRCPPSCSTMASADVPMCKVLTPSTAAGGASVCACVCVWGQLSPKPNILQISPISSSN